MTPDEPGPATKTDADAAADADADVSVDAGADHGPSPARDATADSILRHATSLVAHRATVVGDARVTVGPRMVLVELGAPADGSDGGPERPLAGVAHRPDGDAPDSWPTDADELLALAVATDGSEGDTHTHTDPGADPDRLSRAVGIAALNALSVPDLAWRSGDPMAALDRDVGVVATVGLFRPAFRKFGGCEVRVVERDSTLEADLDAPADVSASLYGPSEAADAFAGADVCFVTGATLVYGGVDRYAAAAAAADVPLVVLVGATASFRPEPAFDAGFDVVAGARVTDADSVRDRVLAGDCGTDLHDHGLEKVFVAASEDLPGSTLVVGGARTDDAHTDDAHTDDAHTDDARTGSSPAAADDPTHDRP